MWFEDMVNLSGDPISGLTGILLDYEIPEPGVAGRFEAEKKADAVLAKLAREHKDDDYRLFLLALVQIKFRFEYAKACKLLKKLNDQHDIPYLKFIHAFALFNDEELPKATKCLSPLLDGEAADFRTYYLAGMSLSPNHIAFKKSLPGFDYLKKAAELCDDGPYKDQILFDLIMHATYYDDEDFTAKARKADTQRVWSETLEIIDGLLEASEERYGYSLYYASDLYKKMGNDDKAKQFEARDEKYSEQEHESGAGKAIDANVVISEADLTAVQKALSAPA